MSEDHLKQISELNQTIGRLHGMIEVIEITVRDNFCEVYADEIRGHLEALSLFPLTPKDEKETPCESP